MFKYTLLILIVLLSACNSTAGSDKPTVSNESVGEHAEANPITTDSADISF
jgi:hypothetical protein